MLRWIVGSSIRIRSLILFFAGAMLVFTTIQLREMPVDVLPEFSPPYVEIQTEALGLSAEEMEQMITVPMEADLLNGVAWLRSIRSETIPGLSSIVIEFEPGTDILRARQMVQERITGGFAILMTATTTALALVPLVIAGQIAGHEIEHPMAVVILGGLVTSTLLNLFVVPVLYLHFGRNSGSHFSTIALPQT